MARTCQCWKTYKCLLCTDNEARAEREAANPTPRKVANRKIPDCGTRSGYNRHRRLGEPTCAECRAAQAEAVSRHQREKRLVNG